ncbi:MAG: fructose 1,6-bisphosphatase [Flavobacteriaceae bacterium]
MSSNEKPIFELHARKDDDSASKIEVIKNLIFGDKIKAYEAEFESLKEDILEKRKELTGLIEEIREELTKSIDDVSSDTHTRLTELENNLGNRIEALEDDRLSGKMLGDLLIELGKKISKDK